MPLLCHWSRIFVSLQVGIPSESESFCPTLGMPCAQLVVPPPPVSLNIVDNLLSGGLMAVVVVIVYGWTIEPHFLSKISSVRHLLLWWWCHQWNHALIPQWLWYPLIRGLLLQYGLLKAVSPPMVVSIGVASLDHPCLSIHLKVDRCLGLLPLH